MRHERSIALSFLISGLSISGLPVGCGRRPEGPTRSPAQPTYAVIPLANGTIHRYALPGTERIGATVHLWMCGDREPYYSAHHVESCAIAGKPLRAQTFETTDTYLDERAEFFKMVDTPGTAWGDPTGDGRVDLDDILCAAGQIQGTGNCPEADTAPCYRRDGRVELDDLLHLLALFRGGDPCEGA